MKNNKPFIALLAAAFAAVATSCAQTEGEDFGKYESMALEAWMTQHRPELVENKQTEGDYYVDVLSAGDPAAAPVNDTICWVNFDFTGRDLAGNIILTRSADDAMLAGTFTRYTHYVPFYRYVGDVNTSLVEGTRLAMRNKLTLGPTYFADNKDRLGIDEPELLLREGAKVVLYMPSRVVGEGSVGSGGYEGQYSLNSNRPFIVTMEIRDTVKNPLAKEGRQVDDFAEQEGGLLVYDNKKEENKSPADIDDARHPYSSPERWVSACDSVPQVYVNFRYRPEEKLRFPTEGRYDELIGRKYPPYNDFNGMEQQIADALVKRFHADDPYTTDIKKLDADSVKMDGTAKIWYIGRFLDGFIFDTNIDEVKQIIYGEVKKKGSVLSYTPESGGMIQAFYYTVPNLKFGQWASLVTTSTMAYGAAGRSGGTSSQSNAGYSSNYLDYLNFLNYSNGYYGNNGYYGGYPGGYYGDYMGGYYGNYGYGTGDYGSGTTETVTTVSTEILPYTPLIFQLYVEPEKE